MRVSLAPRQWVRLPTAPEWGIGQVQTVVGDRVTINFVHAGKRLVHADRAALVPANPQEDDTAE